MTPSGHIAVGTAIGAGVLAATGSWPGAAAALAAGVLPDLDHLLDFYNWFIRHRTQRVLYLLHGWEYLGLAILGLALSDWNPLLLGLTLGYASHVGSDYLISERHLLWYSVIFRASRRFVREDLRRRKRRFPLITHQHPHFSITPPAEPVPLRVILRWLLIRSFPPLRRFLAPRADAADHRHTHGKD